MFTDGARIAGIKVVAKYRIRQCLEALADYGPAAKPMLPKLNQLEKDLLVHSEAKSMTAEIEQLRALIGNLETASGTVELCDLQ